MIFGAKLLHNFLIYTLYITFFATQFISPTTRPVSDREIAHADQLEPITNFGIGEPCLLELTQGIMLNSEKTVHFR